MSEYELIHGDCLVELVQFPDKSINHIIMDPPYEKEAHAKIVRINTKGPGHGKSQPVPACQMDFAAMTESERTLVARETSRVCRGWILVFCQLEAFWLWREAYRGAGAKYCRSALWVKPDAMPQITGDRPGQGAEGIACIWAGKGRPRWNNHGKSGVWIVPKFEKGRVHKAQKPIKLMRLLVEAFTQEGDLICDPYAGAGTTLLAAVELGRNAVGIEVNGAYVEAAEKRIDYWRKENNDASK